ncbi:MAG: asparaginase [Crocinitomicaceae bacterium]|nr:asparaginase [Crocinitomicaceae bacterium]
MQNTASVLLIYTGGTIGMIQDPESNSYVPFNFENLYKHVPELTRFEIRIECIEFDNPIDSSEMKIEDWNRIGQIIYDNYQTFDGFVVLHGSDTMAFTASALSFMLNGLDKPVILTGSQLPIGIIRTDGKENLITAIEIAAAKQASGESVIKEVCIYFEYHLYRGNRTTKHSASHFEAFVSPNFPILAEAGVEIEYHLTSTFKNVENKELTLEQNWNNKIITIRAFPGMNADFILPAIENPELKGIVIESFGNGNLFKYPKLEAALKDFTDRGGILLNITQCLNGMVREGVYESGLWLKEVGAISGMDLTFEAAVCKMMYVLGKESEIEKRKALLRSNLVGEMSI